jgi:hypothetical protein
VESRDDSVVEFAWKLGFGHGRACPACALSAEPVQFARCPRGDLSARRESNAQPVPSSPRGEIVLSLRDRAGTSVALCAVTLSGREDVCAAATHGTMWRAGLRPFLRARGTAPILPSSACGALACRALDVIEQHAVSHRSSGHAFRAAVPLSAESSLSARGPPLCLTCGACSGWPLWLRRERHRPGCRRRRARSARQCQQRLRAGYDCAGCAPRGQCWLRRPRVPISNSPAAQPGAPSAIAPA